MIIEQKLQLKLNKNILLKGQTKWNRERKLIRICKTSKLILRLMLYYICSN